MQDDIEKYIDGVSAGISQRDTTKHTNSELVAFQIAKSFSELGGVHSLRRGPAPFPVSKCLEQANQGSHHITILQYTRSCTLSLQHTYQ